MNEEPLRPESESESGSQAQSQPQSIESPTPEPERPSRLKRALQTEIPIPRKSFLLGMGGMLLGAPLGVLGYRQFAEEIDPGDGAWSFAQGGEDIAVDFFCQYNGIGEISYLDIGAHDPIKINNTYFFYRRGHRGVLVEPNAAQCEKIRQVRPKDTVLEAGIGPHAEREADFYVMNDSSWNTFSKEEAEHQEAITGGRTRIVRVVKMPLLDINEVMEEHFGAAPTFVSIDAEGLHQAILESIDFTRLRPKIICVETLVSGSREMISEIPAFMDTVGYLYRGGSFVNSLFIDSKIL